MKSEYLFLIEQKIQRQIHVKVKIKISVTTCMCLRILCELFDNCHKPINVITSLGMTLFIPKDFLSSTL